MIACLHRLVASQGGGEGRAREERAPSKARGRGARERDISRVARKVGDPDVHGIVIRAGGGK